MTKEETKQFLETLHFHGYIDCDITKLYGLVDNYYPEQLTVENVQLKAEREWISVETELPELAQGVLICISNGMITIGYRSQGAIITNHPHSYHWQLFGDTNKSLVIDENDSVTHWMPLPQLPKQ